MPPTFRMYTTGDIFEVLGEEVMVRSRDGEVKSAEEEGTMESKSSDSHDPRSSRKRHVVSLVELEVSWVGGHTHLLGWLDNVEV